MAAVMLRCASVVYEGKYLVGVDIADAVKLSIE